MVALAINSTTVLHCGCTGYQQCYSVTIEQFPFERNFSLGWFAIPQSSRDSNKFRQKSFNRAIKQNHCFLQPGLCAHTNMVSFSFPIKIFETIQNGQYFLWCFYLWYLPNWFCISVGNRFAGGGGDDVVMVVMMVVMVMMCNKFGDFVYCLLAHKPISPQNTKCWN